MAIVEGRPIEELTCALQTATCVLRVPDEAAHIRVRRLRSIAHSPLARDPTTSVVQSTMSRRIQRGLLGDRRGE